MSGILAVFHRGGRTVQRTEVQALLDSCQERSVDGDAIWSEGNLGLGHQHFWITPQESQERQPLRDAVTGSVLSADVRLDNRAELTDDLGLADSEGQRLSDADLVLRAYRQWGTGCVERLLGDFAFALWDAQRRGLFIGRDALGARSVCYHLSADYAVVASEIVQVLAHPAVRVRLNERKIADHLAFLFDDHEQSFYEDVHYLPPAHCLWITADSVRRWRYWEPQPGPLLRYRNDDEYAEHFLTLARAALQSRMRSQAPIGLSLSGGLDSTLLAALGAGLLPQAGGSQSRLKTFSYAFDELGACDERRFIEPLVARYGLDAEFLPCDRAWTLRHLHAWPVYPDYVLWDPYAWLPWTVMQAAQQAGCRVLLAGYYGDTLWGPGRYWAADLMQRLRLGTLAGLLLRSHRQVRWRVDLIDHGVKACVPEPLKRVYRRLRPTQPARLGPVRLHPGFCARTHLRERLVRSAASGSSTRSLRERWGQQLTVSCFSQPAASVRKEYNARGIEVELPYFDRRLVDFVLALPAEQSGRPGVDRPLHRRALAGLVPDAVRERRGRTVFTPLMEQGLLNKERAQVRAIMSRPQIVEREIVDPDWLRQQVAAGAGWASDGLPLWLCISLELWLRRHWS
jgi:asparagine synthase (glutamine-hydrolysing)